ncbi:MAG: FapA family protein [Fibrobacteria bacterium]
MELKTAPEGAVLRIKTECLQQGMPKPEDVKNLLMAKGVKFGFDVTVLEAALSGMQVDTPILVAKGRPPAPGKDAFIRFVVSPEGKTKPRVSAGDKVDFREMETLVQVKKGDVLAVLEPATHGIPGSDIFGNPIPAAPGKDKAMSEGQNTRLSIDGRSLTAAKSGYLFRQGDTLGVGTTYVVDGDVDFNTGNIHFVGDIEVKGGIGIGFTVEATGSILVLGEVDSASLISSNGNVTIQGGCFGKGKGKIRAKNEVRVAFAQQVDIECKRLIAGKALQDCRVSAFSVDASASGCKVFGGSILSYGSVFLDEAGAEGARTEITILDEQEEAFRKEKAVIEAEEAKNLPQMEALDRRLRAMKALIAKSGATQVPPKVVAEMKTVVEGFQTLRRKLANLSSEKTMLDAEINKPRESSYLFRIRGEVKGTINLDMFHIKRLVSSLDSKMELLVSPEHVLISRPLAAPGKT